MTAPEPFALRENLLPAPSDLVVALFRGGAFLRVRGFPDGIPAELLFDLQDSGATGGFHCINGWNGSPC